MPLAAWSSGMILASGARVPGLNSRSSPLLVVCLAVRNPECCRRQEGASAIVRHSARMAQAWGCEASGSPCVSLNLKGVAREPMSPGESSQMFPMVKGWVCECACVCATGNRSPLCATSDVRHFVVVWSHYDLRRMHQPGIEPGSHRWQRCILPLDH